MKGAEHNAPNRYCATAFLIAFCWDLRMLFNNHWNFRSRFHNLKNYFPFLPPATRQSAIAEVWANFYDKDLITQPRPRAHEEFRQQTCKPPHQNNTSRIHKSSSFFAGSERPCHFTSRRSRAIQKTILRFSWGLPMVLVVSSYGSEIL